MVKAQRMRLDVLMAVISLPLGHPRPQPLVVMREGFLCDDAASQLHHRFQTQRPRSPLQLSQRHQGALSLLLIA